MEELAASIREHGLLEPLILRHRKEGGYEAVSGHRRLVALKKAGLTEARAEVKDMDDAHMKILMGQYNKYRTVTPRERARDYQQQIDGYRELIVSGEKSGRADFAVADMNGVNHQTIQNYIRLNYLIEPLGKLVDEGKLKVTPAIPISYLKEELQADVLDQMDAHDSTPSRHQALLMKDLFEKGKLDVQTIEEIFSGRYREEKDPPSAKQPEPMKPEQLPEVPIPPPAPSAPSQPEAPPAPAQQQGETDRAETPNPPSVPPNAVPLMDLLKSSSEKSEETSHDKPSSESETPPEPETPPKPEIPPEPEKPPKPGTRPEPEKPPESEAPPPPQAPATEQVQAATMPEDSIPANESEQPTPQQPPPQVSAAEPIFMQVPVNEVRRYFKPGTPSEQMRERLIELAKLDWMKQRNQYSR